MTRAAALVALCALGCVSGPPPRPVEPPGPPLPRSSIAVVVQAQAELDLSPEQLDQLASLDEQRERAAAQVRATHEEQGGGQAPAPPGARPPSAKGTQGRGANGGAGGSGIPHRGPLDDSAPPDLDGRLDDLDTQYYLQAEGVLTEAQRPRARELASGYRQQLFERRARR